MLLSMEKEYVRGLFDISKEQLSFFLFNKYRSDPVGVARFSLPSLLICFLYDGNVDRFYSFIDLWEQLCLRCEEYPRRVFMNWRFRVCRTQKREHSGKWLPLETLQPCQPVLNRNEHFFENRRPQLTSHCKRCVRTE